MSNFEMAFLIATSVGLLGANLIASLRVVRRLARYSIPYLFFIWCVPVIGAVFVLAKLRPTRGLSLLSINPHTISNPLTTMPAESWPPTESFSSRK